MAARTPCQKHKRYSQFCDDCRKLEEVKQAVPEIRFEDPKFERTSEPPSRTPAKKLGFIPCRRDTKCKICY